jgi:hypothetical protein
VQEKVDEPHAKRLGRLKNDNKTGDPSKAPRCGAKTRSGASCLAPAMKNGRCRMHGGKSTGPRTPEGLERSKMANWKHGEYSQEAKNEARYLRKLLKEWASLKSEMNCGFSSF